MAVEALVDTRVVVVNGARQVGKSTLAELIVARSAGARELYLDDQAVRAAAEADPSAFVRHDGLLMIDEIQRVPELLLAIKREVDRDTRPGRFLRSPFVSALFWPAQKILSALRQFPAVKCDYPFCPMIRFACELVPFGGDFSFRVERSC